MKYAFITSVMIAGLAALAVTSDDAKAQQALPAMTYDYQPGDVLPVEMGVDNWQEFREYGLTRAVEGTEWVRVDDDAILIISDTGEILYVAYDLEQRRSTS